MSGFPSRVDAALRHVQSLHPSVMGVLYMAPEDWRYFDAEGTAVALSENVDLALLRQGRDEALAGSRGLPCAFHRITLAELYRRWDELANVLVTEDGELETPFYGFSAGTPVEDVWHAFEEENPAFVVGEVMQGIRRPVV